MRSTSDGPIEPYMQLLAAIFGGANLSCVDGGENSIQQALWEEQSVLTLRFGLEDGRSRTLTQVGHVFALTGARIGQINSKALRKLRHPSRSRRLVSLMDDNIIEAPTNDAADKRRAVASEIEPEWKRARRVLTTGEPEDANYP